MRFRVALCLYAALTLGLAAFAGAALAGNGHGNGNGNGSSQQTQAPASQSSTHGKSESSHGNSKHTSTPPTAPTTSDNSTGVKPSSETNRTEGHNTMAPASSNKTKLYGNGKTAGQIATAAGYGSSTLYGPGNSQPHKVNCGSHYVDVHALNAKSKKCAPAQTGSQSTQKTEEEHSTSTPACIATKTVTETVSGGVEHFIGPKGSGRFVVIHPNSHSSHYRDKHPDVILPSSTVTHTVVVGAATCTTSESTSSNVSMASTPTQTAPAPAAPVAGGVLGAIAPLHFAAPKAAGGVLGATVRLGKKVGGTSLPFTGLPLWIFALVAAGLIFVGAVARRAGSEY